jgi:type I restriction enzyme R subunit
MKFTEAKLEQAFADMLNQQGYPHVLGSSIERSEEDVLIEADIKEFLKKKYKSQGITNLEIDQIIRQLKTLPSSDLYESNKTFTRFLSDGFSLKREDRSQKDIWVYLVDFETIENNNFKFVTQLEIVGNHKRIPDGIIYVNGFPLVVFEFKTAIEENKTIHNAYEQLTNRYKRNIPELFKYNSFCVISDGINNKVGSFFAPYEYYYAWRRISIDSNDVDGIDSLSTLAKGLLDKKRLIDVVQNFVYVPDSSKKDEKIVCRYPQYYAVRSLFESIKKAQKPLGNGKGGTYFGATGSGKSFTMLYLARLLMKSDFFENPTLVLITDRTDLDEQLSGQFTNAKSFIGDDNIQSVESRSDLRELLQNRASGGVFLTTIHKFTEDIELLTERNNVICISDEAHRSQTNLDQKIRITENGVKKTYGFAKYLHDSLPNATYVGFTGTPIDATLDVFGEVVDAYTMTESVKDEITVKIVYEGRAAKVALENSELEKIEAYYQVAEEDGANEYQIERSKKQTANMNTILGDPDRLKALAEDFVSHYENRVDEGSTVKGKAMFVCSSRQIAYKFYTNLLELRPEWGEVLSAEPARSASGEGAALTEKEKKEIKPMERVKLIMTRNQDDPDEMYNLLGTKEYKKELDRQFKNEKSNFKIAIVVDMWLTGFDVPFLDTIYIDKPLQKHSLIQTISRVNRRFKGKNKGLVVDYIGIKNQMNMALAMFSNTDAQNFEDIESSLIIVKNHLDLLGKLFHKFDSHLYFTGAALAQLETLNLAVEFIQQTKETETRFMALVKRLKAAYDICTGSEKLTQEQRDYTHFYLAVRSIIAKLTKGTAPDTAQMNAKVKEMITNALQSQGVEEIFKMGEDGVTEQNIFDEVYLDKINKIKLPNTKIKLLQKLLAKAIDQIKQVNKVQGVDFSKKMEILVSRYNERDKNDVLIGEVYEDMANQLTDLIWKVYEEMNSGNDLGIGIEEKAFYDILFQLCVKYDFTYPEEKLIELAKSVKNLVDSQAKFPDWSKREDIKSSLKVGLILMLDEHGYPPVERDEVYQEIFDQAENYKKFN